MRKRIYVAGPYSSETLAQRVVNVQRAIDVGQRLLEAGHAPFVPHLSHFWHERHPNRYEDWLALDFAWIRVADAVLRLPGESKGADRETELARQLGIPVWEPQREKP